MVKRKIVWSHRAKITRYKILEYYKDRNKSNTYSIKLNRRFNKELGLLLQQPDLGIKTDIENVRGLIISDYILFYELTADIVIVHTIWDSRQNPHDLIIK